MMNIRLTLFSIVLVLLVLLSGCVQNIEHIFEKNESLVQYEPYPTIIKYNISYGYNIDTERSRSFDITYYCFLPHVNGNIEVLYPKNYTEISIGENREIKWNVKSGESHNFSLGIRANVMSSAFLVDLNDSESSSLSNISKNLILQYCHVQSLGNNTIPIVDPTYPEIYATANDIKNATPNKNVLDIAKNLFLWLKNNTSYRSHDDTNQEPQTARKTFLLKMGDCDDLSYLYISLCRAVNIPARIVKGYLIKHNGDDYGAVPHAWVEVYVGGADGWIPVECSGTSHNWLAELHQNFGVEDAYHMRLFVGDGSNNTLNFSTTTFSFTEGVKIERFVNVTNLQEMDYKKLTIYADGRRIYT